MKLQSTGREEAEAEFVVRREGRWSKRARGQAEWAVKCITVYRRQRERVVGSAWMSGCLGEGRQSEEREREGGALVSGLAV